MSAFMVEDETINRIICFLANDRDCGAWVRRELFEKNQDWNLVHGVIETGLSALGQAMFQMNADSITHRYGEGEPEKFRPLDYKFKHQYCPSIFQALKSLHCYLYQCTEGNVPQNPLFKLLEEYSNSLAYHIVSGMPEYDQATWS